jgi:hypothetical protein
VCSWVTAVLLVFSIEALCIMNFFLKARQDFHLAWDICGTQCEESDLKCGLQEAASSITILHLLPQHCLLDNSRQNIQFLPFHSPSFHLTYPLWFFLFSELKITLKVIFWDSGRHHH